MTRSLLAILIILSCEVMQANRLSFTHRDRSSASDCAAAQLMFRDLMNDASRAERNKEFQQAAAFYRRVLASADSLAACGLNFKEAQRRSAGLDNLLAYLPHKAHADSLLKARKYAEGMQAYETALAEFENKGLSYYLPAPLKFADYVQLSADGGLALFQAGRLARDGKDLPALEMVKLALQKGITPDLTRDLQLQLGERCGATDFRTFGKKAGAKAHAEEYTHGDSRLKAFRQAYIKQWAKAKKASGGR